MTDLDIIQPELLSTNAITNRSISKGIVVHSGKGSIYTDAEVVALPSINNDHPRYREWKVRQRSTKRLLKQVQQVGSSVNILEVGCGNGWLAAKLAGVTSGNVTGIDVNMRELRQARRVFGSLTNLEFVATDILDRELLEKQFDIIVFAGSIQDFSSLKEVIISSLEHLTLKGQVHILNSPLFTRKNIHGEQQHADEDHIHRLCDLESFQYKMIYNPDAWHNKLFAKRDPFCHIVIKNHYH